MRAKAQRESMTTVDNDDNAPSKKPVSSKKARKQK